MAPGDRADDVQLPDLQVIQRYSLAVRGASAPRADVIAALQADLAWLTGARRTLPPREPAPAPANEPDVTPAPVAKAALRKAAVKRTPAKKAPAAKPTAGKAPAKKVAATKAGSRRR